MRDIALGNVREGTLLFDVERYTSKKNIIYTLEAKSMEIKEKWYKCIHDKLFEQLLKGFSFCIIKV